MFKWIPLGFCDRFGGIWMEWTYLRIEKKNVNVLLDSFVVVCRDVMMRSIAIYFVFGSRGGIYTSSTTYSSVAE